MALGYAPSGYKSLDALMLEHLAYSLSAEEEEQALPQISLHDFTAQAWPIIEPTTTFVDGWHIGAICEHLEAMTAGEILDLIINMPPRHMKSIACSVMWPAWVWTFKPSFRWLYSSYSQDLSTRDSLKTRRLIQSAWYQERWGAAFRLTTDQNVKSRYENNKTGYRIATSVAGSATGEGGDGIVVDDPHNLMKAESPAQRAYTVMWWDQAMSTRRNDPDKSLRLIVQQRLHEKDLAGHAREKGFDLLLLPAEYRPSKTIISPIGWQDPRQQEGELLWPERMGEEHIKQAKDTLGTYGYSSQYQQDPLARKGGLFNRAWWKYWRRLPILQRAELYIDSAFKVGEDNDYSVIAAWGFDMAGSYYLIALWRSRAAYPDLMRAIHNFHAQIKLLLPYLGTIPIIIEDKASGQSALQSLSRILPTEEGINLPALPVIPFPSPQSERERAMAQLSKPVRAENVTPLVEAARVFLPASAPGAVVAWLEEFLLEHERMPFGEHDDIVDTTSMALIRLPRIFEALQKQREKQQQAQGSAPQTHGVGYQAQANIKPPRRHIPGA